MDSSCLLMTLKSGLDRIRSNSLSTSGWGDSKQMESLAELGRLVATLLRVGKTTHVGKGLGGRCSRTVTDQLDEFARFLGSWASGPNDEKSRSLAALGMTDLLRWDSILQGNAGKMDRFAAGR